MYDRADAYSDIQPAGFIGNGEAMSYFSHLIAVLSTQGGVGWLSDVVATPELKQPPPHLESGASLSDTEDSLHPQPSFLPLTKPENRWQISRL